MALLTPVRSAGGGGELGPFISQTGLGAKIVTSILIQADAAAALREVNMVTFGSSIYGANTFIASGGRGLKFNLMVNQDPTRRRQHRRSCSQAVLKRLDHRRASFGL
jgi:hypothetical protein